MSAIEWLPFITPVVWVLLILNGLALFPVKSESPKLRKIKFTIILFVVALLGWLMALLATHIMHHPLARINVLQGSQVILTPTLITLSILLIVRFAQGDNLLNVLLKKLFYIIKPCLRFLVCAAPFIFYILLQTITKYDPNDDDEEDRKKAVHHHINSEGEYAPHDDINYKF